ncbi:MAG: circularly permuted type 2 ATP-grasp protein, partial [Microbacteriaceae bacterium]|nr:circularly permuted type 2 ATP-grasp protein [Microbacteriaceae bacterium]
MGDLFDGYGAKATRTTATAPFDEMFSQPGVARSAYKELHSSLAQMTQHELRGRTDALADSYLAQGVTFDFAGEERPFPLDAVPRVIEQREWAEVERGIKQRVHALEAFLADIYGKQEAIKDGVIPARLVTSSSHFHRQAAGIEPANG